MVRLGLVQMCSAADHAPNIAAMQSHARDAAAQSCDMLALPEVAGCMNRRLSEATSEADDPYINACIEAARAHGLWIHTGSTPIASADGRFLNHSNLIDAQGQIVARYDKIHLFDYYPDDAPPLVESKRYAPGTRAVLAQTPWGGVGMSVCYDLRFPHLYRHYARAGAAIMMIPSAFTPATGKAHWETLLRARAIESGAFVIAAAQVGTHEDGRETYGHSMIVAPWGEVLRDMGDAPGLAVVALDLGEVEAARARIPALTHDRDDVLS